MAYTSRRHCEEQSDAATQRITTYINWVASRSLAMTVTIKR